MSSMKRLLLVLSAALLAGCGSGTDAVRNTSAPLAASGAVRSVPKITYSYLEYSDRGVDTKRGAILFFAKDGDPFSVRSDHALHTLYESGSVSVNTYRVDFPSSTGARLKYGVIVENTFVLLDASGQRVAAFIHPTEDDIAVLVRGRLPSP